MGDYHREEIKAMKPTMHIGFATSILLIFGCNSSVSLSISPIRQVAYDTLV